MDVHKYFENGGLNYERNMFGGFIGWSFEPPICIKAILEDVDHYLKLRLIKRMQEAGTRR